MRRCAIGRSLIIVAGAATAAMGAYHFLLPRLFGWGRFTQGLPAEIQWALFALNAFLSLLLLAGGSASILTAVRKGSCDWSSHWVMIAFWLFNCIYQLAEPFPSPGVRWVLLGFAAAVALFYFVGTVLQSG